MYLRAPRRNAEGVTPCAFNHCNRTGVREWRPLLHGEIARRALDIANAIIDIRLQMLDMTDQEALDLMQKQTFQEAEEATAKLRRAKLSSAQLPMYFVGWRGWPGGVIMLST